jgi:hypothetical protein
MSKFTPGPWSFSELGSQIVDSGKGSSQLLIARVAMNTYFDQGRYNAHLIASAPDMYEALDTLVAVVGLTAFKHEGQRQVLQEAVDLSVAALKKARGEI